MRGTGRVWSSSDIITRCISLFVGSESQYIYNTLKTCMETRCYVSLSFHYIIVQSLPAPRELYLQNRRNVVPLYYFILCIFLGLAGKKDQNP